MSAVSVKVVSLAGRRLWIGCVKAFESTATIGLTIGWLSLGKWANIPFYQILLLFIAISFFSQYGKAKKLVVRGLGLYFRRETKA